MSCIGIAAAKSSIRSMTPRVSSLIQQPIDQRSILASIALSARGVNTGARSLRTRVCTGRIVEHQARGVMS